MMIAFGIFFICNLFLYASLYVYLVVFVGTQLDFEKVTKLEKFEWMSHFFACASLTIMTLIVLWTIISMRRLLQAQFYFSHNSSELDQGLNYLKLRTIDIEVESHSSEITSHKMIGVIKKELRKEGLDATINAAVVMPDHSKLFVLERTRADLITGHKIVMQTKPLWKGLIPTEISNSQEYRKKLDQIEFSVDQQLTKPVKPSSTVFMALGSLKSISFLKQKFR